MADPASLEISISRHTDFQSASAPPGPSAAKAKEAFDSLGALLSESLEPLRKQLNTVTGSADEVELNFSLALKGQGSWVVVSAEASATVSIKIVWKGK